MAEERNDSQEKTERATPKRLEDARGQGQVVRSRELNNMAVLVAGSASLYYLGNGILQSLLHIMRSGFSISRDHVLQSEYLTLALLQAAGDSVSGLAPLLLLLFLVALLAPLLVGGWSFSAEALAFNWDKLDPIQGMSRLLGTRGLLELAKALIKFLLLGALAVVLLWSQIDKLLALGANGLMPGLAQAGATILSAFTLLCTATLLIAAVDVPFQLWEHTRLLKMTKQEVRDEMKETEGRPEVRSRIRDLQQRLAKRRMLEEVPKADVIITNPSHYAVALRYDQGKLGAPRVVARGVDHMAQRIRMVAERHQVTMFSAPLLARALYYNARLGEEIPAGLYLAVAQVLAYVFQLRAWRRDRMAVKPSVPEELSIPEEFRKY